MLDNYSINLIAIVDVLDQALKKYRLKVKLVFGQILIIYSLFHLFLNQIWLFAAVPYCLEQISHYLILVLNF